MCSRDANIPDLSISVFREIDHVKKTLLSSLIVAMMLGAIAPAQAQDAKPIVVATLPSYDELFADLGYLGQLGNKPDMAQGAEQLLGLLAGGLQGLDKTKPIGFSLDANMQPLAFIPVTDIDQFLMSLVAFVKQPKDVGDGVKELTVNNTTIYVKAASGWAFVSNQATALAQLPSDPLKVLDGLNKEYDIAVRANFQSVPLQFRQIAINALEQGAVESAAEA